MTIDPKDDDVLETLFQSARDDMPGLRPDFAERLMPPVERQLPTPRSNAFGNRFGSLVSAIAGLGMATAIGVWIGVAVPLDTFLGIEFQSSEDALDLSAFYPGADPLFIFNSEAEL